MVKILIGVIIVAFIVIGGFMLLDPNLTQNKSGEITEVDETHTFFY